MGQPGTERAAAVTVRRLGGSYTSPGMDSIEGCLAGTEYQVQPGQTEDLVFLAGWDTPSSSLDEAMRRLRRIGARVTEVSASADDGKEWED